MPFDVPPVIHARAFELRIVQLETERLDQMQPALCRQAKSGDVSGIRRNFWFNQHHVEHTTPKTKKAPQCPRRFFRREGMLIAELARRTYLRHFDRFDIDSPTTPVKPYDTVYQGKNRVIAT